MISPDAYSNMVIGLAHTDPVDWSEVLKKEPSDFSAAEYDRLHDRARSWITCACGNQCKKIPRQNGTGKPVDTLLAHLGMGFCKAIENKDFASARSWMERIEVRSADLLLEMEIN